MNANLGDFAEDTTLHHMWSTNDAAGGSVAATVAGEIRVYKDNGVAETVAGITDARDFDTDQVGIHALTIDLSVDAFYTPGSDYSIVLNGAMVGEGSLVAAGAVIPQGMVVPPGTLVAGVPGRVRRELTDAEVAQNRHNAAVYEQLIGLHRDAEQG